MQVEGAVKRGLTSTRKLWSERISCKGQGLGFVLILCGRCSFGGLGCCSCRVCVSVSRVLLSVCVCVCVCVCVWPVDICFPTISQVDSNHAESYANLGVLELRKGHIDAARSNFQTVHHTSLSLYIYIYLYWFINKYSASTFRRWSGSSIYLSIHTHTHIYLYIYLF